MKHVIAFLTLLCVALLPVKAQSLRNCIYLLDCTKSMNGYGGAPNIWQSTKQNLYTRLEREPESAHIILIPFQDQALAPITFDRSDFKWKEVEATLDKYIEKVTGTNIGDPWLEAEKYIDSNRQNYIYLLTDGMESTKYGDRLRRIFQEFCEKRYPKTRGFYVELTQQASIAAELRKIIEDCQNLYVISSNDRTDFGALESKDNLLYLNARELPKELHLQFSEVADYPIQVASQDPHIKVTAPKGRMEQGDITLRFQSAYGTDVARLNEALGGEEVDIYTFTIQVTSDRCHISNPTVKVVVANRPERILQLSGVTADEVDLGEASYYPSFLFSKEKVQDTLRFDLKPLFNEEALQARSSLRLSVRSDGEAELFYNHKPLSSDSIIVLDANRPEALLEVAYRKGANEGNHYLTVRHVRHQELDKVNSLPARDFEFSIRSRYDVQMNPLLKGVLIAAALLVIGLLLWFLLLQRYFFPRITKVNVIAVNDPYYAQYRVKGCYKVICSSAAVRQGTLSRIFRGRELNIVNPCWTTQSEFVAATKGIRFRSGKNGFVATPGALMTKMNDYELVDFTNNETIKITLS